MVLKLKVVLFASTMCTVKKFLVIRKNRKEDWNGIMTVSALEPCDFFFLIGSRVWFTCKDITVVVATLVTANEIYKSYTCMPYCYNVQNANKRYLFSLFFDQNSNVHKIYISLVKIDSANKGLVQEIVILVFHLCLYNKQKITWSLGDTTFTFSCWKTFHSFPALIREIFFNTRR